MKISFDIDDTLVCLQPDVPQEEERLPWLFRPWFPETLRLGTVELMRQLTSEGWDIAVYTTSYRKPRYLKWLFRFYRVRLCLVVNQTLHAQVVGRYPSKNPSCFGMDIHVDDSERVYEEGREFGFHVIVVSTQDLCWGDHVLEECRKFASANNSMQPAGVSVVEQLSRTDSVGSSFWGRFSRFGSEFSNCIAVHVHRRKG